MQQVDIEKAKQRESYIASEFYRVASQQTMGGGGSLVSLRALFTVSW